MDFNYNQGWETPICRPDNGKPFLQTLFAPDLTIAKYLFSVKGHIGSLLIG